MNVARAFVLCALLAIWATSCAGTDVAGRSERAEALYGSAENYDLVAGNRRAGTVSAFRIDSLKGATGDAGNGEISGYAILGETASVGDADAAALGRILGDDATYLFDSQKGCIFSPGIAVRWERRSTTVDVLFCFSCDELEIFANDELVGDEDFDPRRGDILRIVKRLFPSEPEIQALAE